MVRKFTFALIRKQFKFYRGAEDNWPFLSLQMFSEITFLSVERTSSSEEKQFRSTTSEEGLFILMRVKSVELFVVSGIEFCTVM